MSNTSLKLMLESLAQANANANPTWRQAAFKSLTILAVRYDEFTADHVHEYMLKNYPTITTHEPRAMGAIMRLGASCGFIKPTGRYVASKRTSKHASPTAVWRSTALTNEDL